MSPSSNVMPPLSLPRPVHVVQGPVGTARSTLPFAGSLKRGNQVLHKGRSRLQSTNKLFVPHSHLLALERQLQSTRDELERYKEAALGPSEELSPRTLSNGLAHEHPYITEQILETVKVGPSEILTLINQYYTIYDPQFPILPKKETFLAHYNANTLLLWTMLAIASGSSAQMSPLFNSLVDPVRRLAGDLYSHQSRGLEAVQALLLLCAWPFPYAQTVNDPSPMYASLATNIAYQIGLHRPSFRSDFEYNVSTLDETLEQARQKAWYGCFIINHTVTMRLGVPSIVRLNHSIVSEIAQGSSSHLPPILHNLLHIAFLSEKTNSVLGDDVSIPSGLLPQPLRLLQLFDRDFQSIRKVLENTMSKQDRIFFLSSQLHLYSFALNSYSASTPSHEATAPDIEKEEFVAKAMQVIVDLLLLAQHDDQGQSKVWPAFIKQCIIYAASLGVAAIGMSEHSESGQRTSLVEACRAGNSLIQSWSLFNKDHYSRMSTHVSNLLDYVEIGSSTGILWPELQHKHANTSFLRPPIESRMSLNMLYNTIWRAKRLYSGSRSMVSALREQRHGVAASPAEPSTELRDHDFMQMRTPTFDDFGLMNEFADPQGFDIFADWQDLLGNST
ncbi:hypothetical protein A1O3_00246 [Capronia epimyces CBS 606.96]|uniref:Xylanolytic transcriptional activator regulatory domain-containing protein n=1 Tax=Capronia epimyces CBS 606.96 TaxID=1182542 RepID=W9YR05_9EURO|nr:uncharacterized protein A1O3_00246 [Capronia epimyces CBS 606.96]EXJ91696.1 hypothetical protein A1O3_00246 [Capronia epimyces CBS 606.96]